MWKPLSLTQKHCERRNVPKALSTLTHSTTSVQSRSFNKLWNLSQLQLGIVWQLRQIHVTTLTTLQLWQIHSNFGKSMYQFWQIHVTTKRNPCNNFDKSNNLNKVPIKSLRYFLFYHKYIFVGSECHYWIYQIAIHSSIVNTKIISAMSKKTTIYIKPNFSEKGSKDSLCC